ncbi:unnamed protein product, partial [Linum tenue]
RKCELQRCNSLGLRFVCFAFGPANLQITTTSALAGWVGLARHRITEPMTKTGRCIVDRNIFKGRYSTILQILVHIYNDQFF